MALFDDRRFLLSHINHSFITGDDTGVCECVMLDGDVFENQHQRCLKLEGQDEDNSSERLDPEAYDLKYESELFESEQGQSYDIASDLEYICHRRRSNTAQRLHKMTKEKANQSKTLTIAWRSNSPTGSQSDDTISQDSPTAMCDNNDRLLENGALDANRSTNGANSEGHSKSPPKKSGLTKLLEKYPSLPKNPFDEYAQFDGGMSEVVPVKKINIFIATDQPQNKHQQLSQQQINQHHPNPSKTEELNKFDNDGPNDQSNDSSGIGSAKSSKDTQHNNMPRQLPQARSHQHQQQQQQQDINNQTPRIPSQHQRQQQVKAHEPLEVVIVSNATVQDLIGLICWQYTNEGREPKLQHDISRYCLRIAEDNGEVDPDFSSLNPKEPLSKFNFPSLALTEKTEERVRSYNENYANGSAYTHRPPSIAQNVITSSTKISGSKFGMLTLTRLIFKDAKLDSNQ